MCRTPPIRSTLQKSKVDSEIVVGLYDASGDYPQPKAFDFAEGQYSNWTEGWFGVALTAFDAAIELDIDLSASASIDGENMTLSLLKESASWEGVAVEVEFQLFLTAEAKAAMSFTTGLELSVSYWSRLEKEECPAAD